MNIVSLFSSARDKCERVTCGVNATCDATGNCACDRGFQGDGQRCDGKDNNQFSKIATVQANSARPAPIMGDGRV